jgi:hypothetical protein
MLRMRQFTSLIVFLSLVIPAFAQDKPSTPPKKDPEGDLTMAVIGFEQAGASGAKSDQKFFFDFFTRRPLPFFARKVEDPSKKTDVSIDPRMHWWGDVRVASYPQQISTSVAEFSASFATQVGSVPVNKLAQFGEFRTGLDFRVASLNAPLAPNFGAAKQRSSLNLFAGFGALGAFNPPADQIDVFLIPPPNSPQAAAFERNFPKEQYPDLKLAATQYVGLTTPNRNRFYRQYGAGFRLITRFYDSDDNILPAPAMVGFSVGQNELVSGGTLRGVTGKFEGFYPLTIGEPKASDKFIIYLFGRANLHFGHAMESTPLVLQQATGILPDNPGIAVIAQPSARDSYTIGVGIDAVQLISKLKTPKTPDPTTTVPPAPK